MSIKVSNITKLFGQQKALDAVSFEVAKGEITGFLGPNGAGKTTSFYQVVGLIKPDSGTVFLNEQDITDRKSTRLNSSHVSESRMPSSA